MVPPKIEIPPELKAEGRRLYEQTATPLAEIAAMMGISRDTLRNRIREWSWTRRHHPSSKLDLVKAVRGAAAAAVTAPKRPGQPPLPLTPERRAELAARIVDIVDEQMNAVRRVLATVNPKDQAEGEHGTRMLASLAVTLRESAAILHLDQMTAPDAADDDPVPRDIDEFRNELARRIRGFIEAERNRDGEVSDVGESTLG